MTKEEILKAAINSANGGDVMKLARDMAAFLAGEALLPDEFYNPSNRAPEKKPEEKSASPSPSKAAKPERKKTRKKHAQANPPPKNHCMPWTDDDKYEAVELIEKAESPHDLNHIAWQIGRTRKALNEAIYKGLLPLDPTKLNKRAFPFWVKVPGTVDEKK